MNKYKVAKERYLNGESIKKIAKDLQMGAESLSDKLKLDGVELRGKSSTSINWEQFYQSILPLYKEGKSLREIQKITGLSRKKVSFLLKKHEHEVTQSKYKYNEDCFSVVDTEEKAYWLGFMYADGYVKKDGNEVIFHIHEKDKELLERFANFVGENLPLYEHSKKTNNLRVVINNKQIHDDLINKGCTPNKTYTIQFPNESQIPEHLIHHFIRGYMDGDGCLHIETNKSGNESIVICFIGTMDMMSGIQRWMGTNNKIAESPKSEGKGIYTLGVRGNQKPLNILNRIYKDATIFMKRKHEIYQSFAVRKGRLDG